MAKKQKVKNDSSIKGVGLGELEACIMQIIWQRGRVTVKDVFIDIYPKRRLAYTTIMTVMRRLTEKGILEQDRSTRTYFYTPKVDQEKMALVIVENVLNKVVSGSPVDLLISIIDSSKLSKSELKAFELELANSTI
ncbi:MAG: BlaI/MecI/CopY family transcriptional regulator [Actinobacteria bacterium]|nr:BlaI/MecI/CopY family transcriptional regulator [Actinomycetota bacterium]